MSERPSLKPAYLISGSDRPKVETAVQRLRARFVPESVEVVSALELTGADVVTLCNSGSLFADARLVVVTEVDGTKKEDNRPPTGGWKAVDVRQGVRDHTPDGADVLEGSSFGCGNGIRLELPLDVGPLDLCLLA